jgi:hypothetical protein
MTSEREASILANLHALFQAVAEEARANPTFAGKVEATFTNAGAAQRSQRQAAAPAPADAVKARNLLNQVTFDPLECHIEAALMSGQEQEARAFLGKLDHGQLEQVVKAQRLPGAKGLQKAILEGGTATAVDAIVGSATQRIRSRFFTAR